MLDHFSRRLGAVALTAICAQGAAAQDFNAEEYFKDKKIEVVINADPGGGLDTTTRFLVTGLSDYIPGKPTVLATNIAEIPGISAVYDAPVDGGVITIGVTSRVATLYATTLDAAATHDPTKIQILGGYGSNPQWLVVFNDAAKAYNSIQDAAGAEGPVLITSGTVGDPSSLLALSLVSSWMCDTFDMPCKMISVASADMADWAMDIERGQINYVNSTSNALVRLTADALISGDAKVLAEYTEEGGSLLETPYDRPNLYDFLPSEKAKEEFDNLLPLIASGGLGNPVFAGPEVPPEAVAVLAEAILQRATTEENLLQYERGRFGEYPDHDFIPSVLNREDSQRIYEAGMQRFFDSQDFYKELQQRLYDKYWKP